MITNIDRPLFNINGQMNAVTLNTVDVLQEHTKIKVFIPKVMMNIERGEPKISKLQTKGLSVFKNVNKPVLTSQLLKEKNYLETDYNAVSNIKDIESTSDILVDNINDTLAEFAFLNGLHNVSNDKTLSYKINSGTDIRVEFLNGKINKLAYTLKESTDTIKELMKK